MTCPPAEIALLLRSSAVALAMAILLGPDEARPLTMIPPYSYVKGEGPFYFKAMPGDPDAGRSPRIAVLHLRDDDCDSWLWSVDGLWDYPSGVFLSPGGDYLVHFPGSHLGDSWNPSDLGVAVYSKQGLIRKHLVGRLVPPENRPRPPDAGPPPPPSLFYQYALPNRWTGFRLPGDRVLFEFTTIDNVTHHLDCATGEIEASK